MDNGNNLIYIFSAPLSDNIRCREFLYIFPTIPLRIMFYRNCNPFETDFKIPEGIRPRKHCAATGFRKELHIYNDHCFGDCWNDYRIFRLSSCNNHLLSFVNHCNVDSSKIKKSTVIPFI